MTDPLDSKPTEPRRTAAISSGGFVSGSVFQLVREIRGSAYSVGDQFMLIEGEDCHDPNVLILGGVGENYFIDPHGKPLKIEAGDTQIDSIFELVEQTPQKTISEGVEVAPPTRVVTEAQFKAFREGLAGVLNEIAAAKTDGERGERGPRGFTGVQGDRGDAGPQGPQGEKGERGETGEQGERGEQGEKGDTGETGPQGERGEPGPQGDRGEQGERGEKGERGERGLQGERGQRGAAGERGEAGPQGPQGERGAVGAAGADGRDGAAGPRGERGEAGARGIDGKDGKAGAKGAKGEKGDKGDTGESGVVTAKFPLVYDAEEKSIAIDEERLDKILKKIMGGGKVSPQDMGWLASTGGGGKVAVYHNGTKITPDVRGIDFTGSGVASVTKVGGKITVNIQGGGGYGSTGPTGPTGAGGALGYWGSFWSTQDQVATLANTEYQITLNNTDSDSNGVSISNSSRINFAHSGVYSIIYSVQFVNTGNQIEDVDIWLKKNGSNVADTDSRWSVVASHAGVDGHAIGSVNYMLEVNAGDYLQLAWKTTHADLSIQYLPAVAPAPAVPSVILTAQQVMYTQVGPTGPTGPTGPMPTDYVSSFNGLTGAVQGVSSFNGQTGAVSFHDYVASFNGVTGAVEGVCAAVAGTGISVSGATGTVTITNTGVQSFNGVTGAVQGVSSWNGQTGAVSFHNYVSAFNGHTGSVQGVSSANGFTGAVTWLAGTGLEVSSGGGAITYGIGAGYALMRSVGNTGELFAIENPAVGDLVFVQDRGTYYYWDYYSAGGTYDWINISLISNALQGDLNGDGTVNGADLGVLLGAWGSVYSGASLRMGVTDGLTGAFVVFADGSANPKKSDMVRVSTEGAVSEFRVNTDNLYLTGLTEINGENTEYVALRVINGKTELSGDTTVNGNLQIDNGGLLGGFVDGGTFA